MSKPVQKYDDPNDYPDLTKAQQTDDFEDTVNPDDNSEAQVEAEKFADLKERTELEDMHQDDDDSDAPEGYSEES